MKFYQNLTTISDQGLTVIRIFSFFKSLWNKVLQKLFI